MADKFTGMQYGNGGVTNFPYIPTADGYQNAPYTESVKVDGGISGYTPNRKTVPAAGNMLPQLQDYYFQRHALIEAKEDTYFLQFATVENLAAHTGKTIKQYIYYPLIDDRNINDQGIDATGAKIENGNFYGSSKDISTILKVLPTIGETGGRYNRVGFTRGIREGTIAELGFFFEFTEDELTFDSDPELYQHYVDEAIRGANKIQEALMAIDLICSAGLVQYGGTATSISTMDATSEITYKDLLVLGQRLRDNKVPTQTKILTGSRNIDTKTVKGGWSMIVPSGLRITFETMKDLQGRPAFIPTEKYGDQTTLANGEIGRIGEFRIIEDPYMPIHAGKGATAADGYASTNEKFNVYPMVVIGDDSFATIGFQSDGKTSKFNIIVKKPGSETANAWHDPYGKTGFWSIQWRYGLMVKRPERLACLYTTAKV